MDFSHTGNVVEGAPVKLGGVAVGRVEEIRARSPSGATRDGEPLPVRMEVSVEPEALEALHEDARGDGGDAWARWASRTWSCGPGSADAPPLAGRRHPARRRTRRDWIWSRCGSPASSRRRAGCWRRTRTALDTLVTSVSGITQSVDAILGDNREEIAGLAGELQAAARDLRALAALARKTMEPGGKGARLLDDAAASARVLREDVPQLSGDAKKVLGQMATLSGELGPEDVQQLKLALERYSAAGEKLERLATRGEQVMARLEPMLDPDAGTLGALASDPALYEDLKALVEDLRKHPWKILWKD